MGRVFILSVFVFLLIAQYSLAQIPKTMNYQGLLTNASGKPVADGNYSLTFRLYSTDIGGAALWTETHPSVSVVKGVFNVILGSGGSPLNLPFDQQYWLGTQVWAGTELTPRLKLASTPYSLNSQSVANGAITTSKLADNAVTVAKIQPDVLSSVNGVSNDGGNIDLVQQNAITVTPNDSTNTIAIGESHSARTDNPHNTTAIQTGALVSVEGVSNPGGNINLIPGSNVTIVGNDATNAITISATGVWKLAGNSGTTPGKDFLGTIDDNALELRVNNARVLRLEPNLTSPNIIGGFSSNSVTSGVYGATISGGGSSGSLNRVPDIYGTIGGGKNNQAGDDAGTTSDVINATVGGGSSNAASGTSATVGGGQSNEASGRNTTFGGGYNNAASNINATVGGGNGNAASGAEAAVGGGYGNTASGDYSTISGGGRTNVNDPATGNRVTDNYGTVGGGGNNQAGNGDADKANAIYATVGGGEYNFARGSYATVPGGKDNYAYGDYSFAAGNNAHAYADGVFVWADSSGDTISISSENRFVARASGGTTFYSASDLSAGVKLNAGGNSWSGVSDRNMKRNIREVDVREILTRLAQVPISRWSYLSQPPSIEHIGPMAQDFYAAFGLDEDNKHISTVDADGVALAAIQGLYEIVQEKDAKIAQLEARLAALEKLVSGSK